jgi:phosphoribosyl 1,2-cyclic phosphate phosphodiesterase
MNLRATILGCGSSGGVPRCNGDWGKCDPSNPKNRRRRCSVLMERGDFAGDNRRSPTRVLIDTAPDMRQQMLDAGVTHLNAVLYTHDHADHTHGIDELRVFAQAAKARVPVYMDPVTSESLRNRFSYGFKSTPLYPPILEARQIEPLKHIRLDGPGGVVTALPFPQQHAKLTSWGFRFGGIAYSPDVNDLPPESVEALQGLDVWIVDALRYQTHPGHFSVEQALAWVEKLKPRRTILTHLHVDLDYEALRSELPATVEPAFDGLVIDWQGPNDA